MTRRSLLHGSHGGLVILVGLSVAISTATRLALLGLAAKNVTWDTSVVAAFAWGAVFDLAAAMLLWFPVAVLLVAIPGGRLRSPLVRTLVHSFLFLATYGLLIGAVGEWLFWDEFGARFNFIAVDYLVYTTEVLGNIRESYPLPWIFSGLFVAALAIYAVLLSSLWVRQWLDHGTDSARSRWAIAGVWLLLAATAASVLSEARLPPFKNAYNRELAKNGLWSLFAAFRANQLDYERYYRTLPVEEAFRRVTRQMDGEKIAPLDKPPRDLLRRIENTGDELRLNVIQITVESLSASFLARYGNTDSLTPSLDGLARNSLVFDRFYATGTRTDRGMEALTLSVPPTPGRSLIKRPNNGNLFTLGSVFRSKGYSTAFIYGGFGYFDNMNVFFGGNGYRVVDRASVSRNDITFANAWGACDEDLYSWVLREADRDFASGRPFFHFVMTTSNHRPFTFPEGRIDLPSKTAGRNGAVKYSDFAIGDFLARAREKAWFTSTVFVIVGDHCASSAGQTVLPLQNYRVPLMVYAPGGQIAPDAVLTATSQIDYAPTLLGLLRWSYPSRFFGRDVLSRNSGDDGPLYIGTYQKLGMYRRGGLAVLEPLRAPEVFDYHDATHRLTSCGLGASSLIDDAISSYQVASWLFSHGVQRELDDSKLQP